MPRLRGTGASATSLQKPESANDSEVLAVAKQSHKSACGRLESAPQSHGHPRGAPKLHQVTKSYPAIISAFPNVSLNPFALRIGVAALSLTALDLQTSAFWQVARPDCRPKDIVDTAVSCRQFKTTFHHALTAAGLVDTLKGEGPFTVFAFPPTKPSRSCPKPARLSSLCLDAREQAETHFDSHLSLGW